MREMHGGSRMGHACLAAGYCWKLCSFFDPGWVVKAKSAAVCWLTVQPEPFLVLRCCRPLHQAGCSLEPSIIPLLVHHLASSQQDTRSAAAAALADELRQHTSAIASTLQAVLALYGEDSEEEDEAAAAILLDDAERAAREQARQVQAAARRGVAAGLEALAGVLGDAEVVAALDFLVARGLAEPDDAIRAAMVGAGAQGGGGAQGGVECCLSLLSRCLNAAMWHILLSAV